MNQQDNQELNKQESLTEDLIVNEAEAEEVKGGPIYMTIDGVDGDVTAERTTSTGGGAGKVIMQDIHYTK